MSIDHLTVDLVAVEPHQVSERDLYKLNVVGRHCTRAIRKDIERLGLRPLSTGKHVAYAKEKLTEFGLAEDDLRLFYRSVQNALCPAQRSGREGKLWFCLNRSLFEDDDGCEKLFRFFGGEAIFRPFMEGSDFSSIRGAMSSIGQPLLVTARIPLRAIPSFQRDRVVSVLLLRESTKCEAYVTEPIRPSQIISITPWEDHFAHAGHGP